MSLRILTVLSLLGGFFLFDSLVVSSSRQPAVLTLKFPAERVEDFAYSYGTGLCGGWERTKHSAVVLGLGYYADWFIGEEVLKAVAESPRVDLTVDQLEKVLVVRIASAPYGLKLFARNSDDRVTVDLLATWHAKFEIWHHQKNQEAADKSRAYWESNIADQEGKVRAMSWIDKGTEKPWHWFLEPMRERLREDAELETLILTALQENRSSYDWFWRFEKVN